MRVCTKQYTGTKGVYAHFTPDRYTAHLLTGIVWSTHPPFPTYSVPYTSHVTAMCSDSMLTTIKMPFPKKAIYTGIEKVDYWKQPDGKGIAVFVMDSPLFQHVHSLLTQRGAVHRYNNFIPHVTIALNLEIPEHKVKQWVARSNLYLNHEKHTLTFNRLKIRDMQF